jgi:ribosomal-protein-alanine N-acetyltransferase
MKNIIIRRARQRDIPGMVKLEQECFTTDRMPETSFRRLLRGTTAAIVVADSAGQVIGSSVLLFRKNSKNARVYSIAVHADYRAQGVALELNRHLEKSAKQRGAHAIILEVNFGNSRALKFYEKLGYENWGTYPAFYEDGSDALRMIKRLV